MGKRCKGQRLKSREKCLGNMGKWMEKYEKVVEKYGKVFEKYGIVVEKYGKLVEKYGKLVKSSLKVWEIGSMGNWELFESNGNSFKSEGKR